MFKRNLIGIGLVQVLNFSIPLVSMPIIFNMLNVNEYGRYSFYFSISIAIGVFCDMGTSTVATTKILLLDSIQDKLLKYYELTILKIFGLFFSCLISVLLVYIEFPEFFDPVGVAMAIFGGICIGLNPSFYLIAEGNMMKFAKMSFYGKMSGLIMLFIMKIISINTYGMVLLANYLPMLLVVIFSNYSIARKLEKKNSISISNIFLLFREVKSYAVANLMTWTYASSPTLIIGKIYGVEAVGIYGVADKIFVAVKAIISPFLQSAQPWVVAKLKIDNNKYYKRLNVVMALSIAYGVFSFFLLYFGGDFFLQKISGGKFIAALQYLKILSLMPLFTTVSWVLGNIFLGPSGLSKEYFLSISLGLFSFIISLLYFSSDGKYGVAYAILIAELIITIAMTIYFAKYYIKRNSQ